MNGVAALVRLGVFLDDTLGMEILSIGRESFDPENSSTLIATGKWLCYFVRIDGGFVFLKVSLMDQANDPEQLLSAGDVDEGWRQIFTLIRALERNQIKSLTPRPLEIGDEGPNGFVIGD
jgi:hypothetical protein